MAFKMKGNPYKMGGHKTKATMAYMKSPLEQAKPDYPDIDGDGNTTESMKKAAADKKGPMEMKSPMKDARQVWDFLTKEEAAKVNAHNRDHSMGIDHKKSPTQMKSPLEQQYLPGSLSDKSGTSISAHSNYEKDEDYAPVTSRFTKGKGKRTRFDAGSGADRRNEIWWIRDNYGVDLNKRQMRKAKIDYYNTYGPQMESNIEEDPQQYTGQTYEKETQYPTNKRTSRTFTGGMPQYKQVWDETVNKGEGGYVKVDSQGRKEYEEGYNLNPSKEDMEIPMRDQ